MKILICISLLAASFSSFSQTPAFDKNVELDRRINLGNMFEAPSSMNGKTRSSMSTCS